MSIKTRLLLSYIGMTFIPVVLFGLIATSIVSVFYKDLSGVGEAKGMPAFWETSNQRKELIAGVKFMAQTDPDRFTDIQFVKNTDEQLNRLYTGIIVMKSKKVMYNSPFVKNTNIDKLQELQYGLAQEKWGKKVDDRFTVEKYEIKFSDRSNGTVYLLSDLNLVFSGAKKFFPLLILAMLLVVGLTNGILTFMVSRSIIKPLDILKNAAELIKEGNLNVKVNLKRKDEIGEFAAAFEEMRIRLKESIRLQLQYEENRKELISNISHDLKTPITGIKMCVQGIQEGIADTVSKREKYMHMIEKKTEEMDHLIEELMLYSKLDLNSLPFHLERIDIKAYLNNYLEELRIDPRMEGIQITFFTTINRPVIVIGDYEKLGRVIMNIIQNSLKYMDKAEKKILVELFDDKTDVTVHIKDNGPGIMNDALSHIFDRFYRVEPSRNKKTGGTGLGLAIVKQIVEGQGGKVWAQSQLGEGTSIYFTLPKIKNEGEHE